jgi:hypothetical protein
VILDVELAFEGLLALAQVRVLAGYISYKINKNLNEQDLLETLKWKQNNSNCRKFVFT